MNSARQFAASGDMGSRVENSSSSANAAPLPLRIGFWICIAIAVAVVVRRVLALAFHPQVAAPSLAALDAVFASHAALTLAHILPAMAFVVIAPFVVFRRAPWSERLIYPLGAVVGITAYAMATFPVGGWVERSAVLLFDSWFLYSLFRAYRFAGQRREEQKRRWLLRAIVVLLGIATTRPVMGVFFATSVVTHWTPNQFFGYAFWIGFSINTLAIEIWLRSRSRRAPAAA